MSRTVLRRARVEVAETPLRRPFVTALGRRVHTTNVGLSVRLSGGAEGYGEASTSLAMKHLTPAALERALTGLARRAQGRDVRDWKKLVDEAWARAGDLSPAVAAFEAALLSALAAEAGMTLASWFGGASSSLETDLTLSAWTDDVMTRDAAAEAARDGFKVLKIKIGGAFADDLARVRAARRGAPRARLLLDGNQGLTPSGALKLLDAVLKEGAKVDLLEQPVRKDDLKNFKEITDEIASAEKTLAGKGRVFVRLSGTEPIARVMVEGEDLRQIQMLSKRIAGSIVKHLGA
ncbi:MAG: hypothetical protein HY075_01395 [Deltaproteobacteria bacterium]|nr:hypothetical protein [Deltaproteobacteria bacterium]